MYSPRSVSTLSSSVVPPRRSLRSILLGGHGFGFDDQFRAVPLGGFQHEIGHFRGIPRPAHLTAVSDDVALEFLEVPVEILNGVPFDGVCLVAQLLIVGERFRRNDAAAMVHQPRRRGIDGLLQPGIG